MSTNIGTGKGGNSISMSSGQKAAESRAINTKNEVEYIAKTYFEFAQFAYGSGLGDPALINSRFDDMIKSYIDLGKIKRESYNKFKTIYATTRGINVRSMTKEDFVSRISKEIDRNIATAPDNKLSDLRKDFNALLNKYNIAVPDEIRTALYVELGISIANIYRDNDLLNYFSNIASSNGLGKVLFCGPQIVERESDGCSGSRTTYASLWKNLDKIK